MIEKELSPSLLFFDRMHLDCVLQLLLHGYSDSEVITMFLPDELRDSPMNIFKSTRLGGADLRYEFEQAAQRMNLSEESRNMVARFYLARLTQETPQEVTDPWDETIVLFEKWVNQRR